MLRPLHFKFIYLGKLYSMFWCFQALTPHMQSPTGDLSSNKTTGRLHGPALGDQQQGSFSINLWKNAFQDALQRLCPVRAGGHECGCLPIIARMVFSISSCSPFLFTCSFYISVLHAWHYKFKPEKYPIFHKFLADCSLVLALFLTLGLGGLLGI
jgi:hypothetical protein